MQEILSDPNLSSKTGMRPLTDPRWLGGLVLINMNYGGNTRFNWKHLAFEFDEGPLAKLYGRGGWDSWTGA